MTRHTSHFQRLLDFVVSSEWFLRSWKFLYGDSICRCPFSFLLFQCIFQTPVDDEQSIEEDDQRTLRCNFIFFMSSCVKLFFYCTTNCFFYMNQIWDIFWCLLQKKKTITWPCFSKFQIRICSDHQCVSSYSKLRTCWFSLTTSVYAYINIYWIKVQGKLTQVMFRNMQAETLIFFQG